MISLVSILVVLLFLVLAALVANVGLTTNRKMETQNAADASASSSALWLARGLNAVTAANHVMGEMLALVTIHSALAEKHDAYEPRQTDRFRDRALDLRLAHQAAQVANPALGIWAYDQMDNDPEVEGDTGAITAGAMVSDGRHNLMLILTHVYHAKTAAGILEKIPILNAIGYAIDGVCLVLEIDILIEWKILWGVDVFYRNTKSLMHDGFFDNLMPQVARLQKNIRRLVPKAAGRTAAAIAERNGGAFGALYPREPELPLQDDPFGIRGSEEGNDRDLRRSQLIRAAYPWVKYHRRPLLEIFNWMKLSRAAYFYTFYTYDYTLKKGREFYRKHDDCWLPVLKDSNPDNKGREPWVRDSRYADRLFAVIAFAHRDPPKYAAPVLFRKPNSRGLAAYAMAMVYNANHPHTGVQAGDLQPEAGWDTLNWEPPMSSSHAYEYPLLPGNSGQYRYPVDPDGPHHRRESQAQRPRIRLNWQAKLMPASSYLSEAVPATPGPHREILRRMIPVPQEFRTH